MPPPTDPTLPPKPAKLPIPWWGWVFAAACVLIPILSLGGAIPGALGGGGAFGCVAAARAPKLSTGARIGICAAITVGCWVLFIVFAVAAAAFVANRSGAQ